MKYLTIAFFSLVIGLNIGHFMTKKQREIDSKVYVPGERKRKVSIWHILGFRGGKYNSYILKEKSRLKQIGTIVAMYYTDGRDAHYPKNPQKFDFDESLFKGAHLSGKYIDVPKNWKIPDSWKAFNQSNSRFVFLHNHETEYKYSSETPMFITRYGYQAGKDFYQVVYEDGHVASVSYDEAVELWKQAGVWNGEGK